MGWNVQKHLHSSLNQSSCFVTTLLPRQSITHWSRSNGWQNHLVAMVFGAVTNALTEPHLRISGLFEHQMKWLTSQVNNFCSFIKKKQSFNTQPNPAAISRHGQMLRLNCSAAGEALVGIFATVSLCMFLPECWKCVLQGMLAYFGMYGPFCLYSVRHRHAHTHACARSNGVKCREEHRVCWHACQRITKRKMHTCAHTALACLFFVCQHVPNCLTLCTCQRRMIECSLRSGGDVWPCVGGAACVLCCVCACVWACVWSFGVGVGVYVAAKSC